MPTATVTPCVFNVTLRVDDGVMIQDFNFNVTILSPPPLVSSVQIQIDTLNQTEPPYFQQPFESRIILLAGDIGSLRIPSPIDPYNATV